MNLNIKKGQLNLVGNIIRVRHKIDGAQPQAILSQILIWLEMRAARINTVRLTGASNGPRDKLEDPHRQTETISVSKRTMTAMNQINEITH